MSYNGPAIPDGEEDVVSDKDRERMNGGIGGIPSTEQMLQSVLYASLSLCYLICVLLTRAVSVRTMTGMARLKKQFLNDSKP